ncbi:hypothetical protein G7054_g9732 [Neopestalotiopsis clavispora]|nr:hypothetical protein G7054_g9732 [Neopestalotiopsis clavispora]
MNFQGLGHDYARKNRSDYTYRTYSSNATAPTSASQVTVVHAPLVQRSGESAPPSPPTVVPYLPSPPSTPEQDSPARIERPQRTRPRARARPLPQQRRRRRTATYNAAREPVAYPRSTIRFHPNQVTMTASPPPATDWIVSDFRDELVRNVETSVTPGVDSTPYIIHALETMTQARDDARILSAARSSSTSQATNPILRYLPSSIPGLFQPKAAYNPVSTAETDPDAPRNILTPEEELAALRRHRKRTNSENPQTDQPYPPLERRPSWMRPLSSGTVRVPYSVSSHEEGQGYAWGPEDTLKFCDRMDEMDRTPPPRRSPRDVENWQSQNDAFANDAESASMHPRLDWRPWTLRLPSLLTLAGLCVLMIAALVFCAVFSDRRQGLKSYSGTIYDGYYFLFRILPQLLAALLLLYAQIVITAAFRVLPFSALAAEDVRTRRNVGFLPLYPKTFLWPQHVSTWRVRIPIIMTWLLNFTIPLQSCLFTVVYIQEQWIWCTVQGVAWVLVALYVFMLLATLNLASFWHHRRTGLGPNWDMRSLADIISLLAPSNSAQQFSGTESAVRRNDMRHMLFANIERLGYWRSPEAPELNLWYGIGSPAHDEKVAFESLGDYVHEKGPRGAPPNVMPSTGNIRSRYLPWCIRDAQVISWAVATGALLVTLFVVCFNPRTDIRKGFMPLISAAPVAGAFSAADFLYSFLPALLGMVIFLGFQSLDLMLRILTPWGELSHVEGSLARNSILLDYAACLPLESTWKALKHGHWKVAFISLFATFSFLIPVLAGGMFMALTAPDHIVRMYPNVPVLAIILTLLTIMLLALVALMFNRNQFHLPHAVTCLNEIISFCYAEELRADPAFQWAQSHRHLKQKLGAYMDNAEQSRWFFSAGYGRKGALGVRRYGKYTGETPFIQAAKRREREKAQLATRILREAAERDLAYERQRQYEISRPVPQGNSAMISP